MIILSSLKTIKALSWCSSSVEKQRIITGPVHRISGKHERSAQCCCSINDAGQTLLQQRIQPPCLVGIVSCVMCGKEKYFTAYVICIGLWNGARSMLDPRYIDAGPTSKTTPGQSLCDLWICCTRYGPPWHRGEKVYIIQEWNAWKDETHAQRQASAGPTSSMVDQHWASIAPMSRVCKDVYRKVWLYNLDYNRVEGVVRYSHWCVCSV